MFRKLEHGHALKVAREAEKFARQIRTIPVSRGADPHPEVREVLTAFQRINKLMATRTDSGEITFARKARIGREFQRIGAALRRRPTRRRAKR